MRFAPRKLRLSLYLCTASGNPSAQFARSALLSPNLAFGVLEGIMSIPNYKYLFLILSSVSLKSCGSGAVNETASPERGWMNPISPAWRS